MSLELPLLVLVLAVVTAGASWLSPRWSRLVNLGGWLALAGSFVFLFTSLDSLAAAAATAALAGLVTTRCLTTDAWRRRRILAASAIVPAAVAVAALISIREASTPWSGQLVIFTAAWGAMVAGATSLCAACAVGRRPLSAAVPIAALGVIGGVAIAATGRSSLPDAFYGFPLRTADEPLVWLLDPIPGMESGLRLGVAAPVDQFPIGLAAIAALLVLAAIALQVGRSRIAAGAIGAGGLTAIGLAASIPSVVSGLSVPAAEAYADHVKRLILAAGANEGSGSTGHFNSTADVIVAMSDLAPEIFGLAILIPACIFAFIGAWRSSQPTDEQIVVDRAFARDHFARGVAFLWLSWFVMMIAHNGLLGTPALASPGEWVFIGFLLCSTGLMLATWRAESGLLGQLAELMPGAVLAAFFVVCGLAWRFGALPGMSLGVF